MEEHSSISQLEGWLQSAGIWWDTSLMQIRGGCGSCSGPALGVFAVSDVQENQLLCVIPRSAILSPRTTQLAQILEAEKLGGGLALSIAVMYEASLGQASKWAGYFASLPAREYLPMFWSRAELDMLAGTALEGVAEDDRRDTQEDYETHVAPLTAKYKEAFLRPDLCSLQHFRTAASWVASRSFHVDSWHGDAMVPLADVFNHKASLVLLQDGWQVAEEADRQQQQQHQHDEAVADMLDEDAAEEGSDGQQADNSAGEDGDADGSDHSSDDADEADDDDDEDGDEENPQHGFAVGGMPILAAAAAAAGAGADGSAPGIVQKAAAGCWVRDGVNLRLEIGICSMGPPDTTLASITHPGSAAAAAAAAGDGNHEHDAQCGCSWHGVGADSIEEVQQQQQQQQSGREAPPEPGSQQRKKQKTEQRQTAANEQADANTRQQQQQQRFPDKRLEILAASPIPAGAEVHNTYGELPNQALLHKYGFCLPANPFDELALGPGWAWLLQEVAAAAGLAKQLQPHVAWLERHSHLLSSGDTTDDDEVESAAEAAAEPPAVLPGGRVPSVVAAAVRLLGASAAQLKAWHSLQEVLQVEPADTEKQKMDSSTGCDHDGTEAAAAIAAEKALAEHFDDVQITGHSLQWWGRAGLQLLRAAVQQRLQRYPGKGLSTAADEQALRELRSARQQQQQQQQQQQGSTAQSMNEQKQAGDGDAAEHAVAAMAALQLRICEQRILRQALDAVEQVLG